MTEIEVDGVGIYRLPNDWQYGRLGRLRGEKRHTAVLAFGCGMTVRQFAKLPTDRHQAVHKAYLALMSPPDPRRLTMTLLRFLAAAGRPSSRSGSGAGSST